MKKPLPFKKKILASLIRTAVVTAVAMPAMSWAQSSDAGLRGKAPPEMQVTAKNVATGLRRTTMSSADGSYSLVGLPPGTYQVDAGPGTEKTVTLSVASTGTLDFAAPAAASAAAPGAATLEGITVTGTALAEVKTSEVGNTVSLHQIATVPQSTRNFLEFADAVPGMIFNTDSTGHTSLQGGAQNTSSVNVYIDGVGQKSYVKQGGVSGQFSSQGNPFAQLAIGEYKVITSNYKAEYDQVSSAAVTAVTKSGTNDFHGEVFYNYTDQNYRDSTPSEKAAGKKTPSQQKEYGFAAGGPIIQDQMHFFFTYERKTFDSPVTVVPGVADATSLLPASVQSQLGPAGNPFTEDLYFGKIDWEFSDRDRIELSGQYRNEDTVDNVGNQTAASGGIVTKNTDKRYDLRWEHTADNWFNELLFTYENAFNVPQAITSGIGAKYTFGPTNDGTILNVGAPDPRAAQNKGQKGPAIADNLTFNNLNWMGDHTIKMGFKFKDVKLVSQDAGDATGQFYYNVCPLNSTDPTCPPGTGTTPYAAVFAVPSSGFSPIITSKDKQYGAYIQDDWVVNDHLTLNLGIRWDMEKNPSYLNWVTPANVVNALLNGHDPNAPAGVTYAQQLAAGGVNINDYISNGHNRSAKKDQWQPRLGFSYDLNGDEEHVIFGGAGRSYDRDLYDYLQLEQTKFALSEPKIYFSSPGQPCKGSPCFPWGSGYTSVGALQTLVQGSNAGQEYDALNNNLKTPYSDQLSIGMRNKVGDWNTGVTVARVVSKDGFVFTLGNRYPNGAFWQNGSQPWGDAIPGFGALILGNNGIETRSTQVLLSTEKPYTKDSGWGVSFAYTYTHATQNRDINEHYSFDQATIQQYAFITSNAAPKHRLVVTGSYDGFWDITFGGKLTLSTPYPHNGFLQYAYPATAPNGANNLPISGIPSGGKSFLFGGPMFGYRSLDLQATKNFDLTRGMIFYLRADLINAMNYKNLIDVSDTYPTFYPVYYNTKGNISGYPRTFKFTMGFKW
ncbi:TonB-dependent receptor [Rudaea sp.]|uniref:TonB-dependent receptor n=1 Tax=Rudaea sp. TaxID=2136325 RepID=UPI0032201210